MTVVYVVTEDAGYDVGMIICGVFSTREKADGWVGVKRDEYASKVMEGKATGWGAPVYDIEEYQVDPEVKS